MFGVFTHASHRTQNPIETTAKHLDETLSTDHISLLLQQRSDSEKRYTHVTYTCMCIKQYMHTTSHFSG